MGLLISISLITWNVYGSTNAPPSRGFSKIELWITGIQCLITFAIFEYSCILAVKRTQFYATIDLDKIITLIDLISFIFSLIVFIIFNGIYWNSYIN